MSRITLCLWYGRSRHDAEGQGQREGAPSMEAVLRMIKLDVDVLEHAYRGAAAA
jgi:hypothetical protein